jgi:hypothetical protein
MQNGDAMRRFLFVLVAVAAPGCAGFDEYVYDEPAQEVYAPASFCQNSPMTGVSPSTGLVPSVATTSPITAMSGAQTREPELAAPRQ